MRWGVKLGGRTRAAQPLELTRETLRSSSAKVDGGKCPFSDVVAGMEQDSEESNAANVEWSPEARERLKRIPEAVRPVAKMVIEQMALGKGSRRVDETLMDEAKDKFVQ